MTTSEIARPEEAADEVLEFLDNIRSEGSINMMGASPLLMEAFDLPKRRATEVLTYWMKTFSERHPQ